MEGLYVLSAELDRRPDRHHPPVHPLMSNIVLNLSSIPVYRRLFNLFRIASLAVLAIYVHARLSGIHWTLSLIVTLFAVANVATVWMLRACPQVLVSASGRSSVRPYIRFVCFCCGESVPVNRDVNHAESRILLRTHRQFAAAAWQAKQVVRGHDEVIDGILQCINENIKLRKSRRDGARNGPLASFLLVGSDSVGKRYLARVIAKLLYGSSRMAILDCDRLTPSDLLCHNGPLGLLLKSVDKQPCQAVLFKHVDKASMDVAKLLHRAITAGKLRPVASDHDVSLDQVTVFMSIPLAATTVECLQKLPRHDPAWRQLATDCLQTETQLDAALLNGATAIHVCQPPTDRVRAEVLSLLMQKACNLHGLKLAHVEPAILANEVLRMDETAGLKSVPQQATNLLRKPLIAAADHNHEELILRVRMQPSLCLNQQQLKGDHNA
jgi:hypothetical protein